MKKILVPLDFSTHSIYAVESAIDIAKNCGAHITFIHIVKELSVDLGWIDYDLPEIKKEAELDEHFKSKIDVLCNKFGFDNYHSWVENSNSISEAIIKEANDKKYELLVMGCSGTNNDGEHEIGDNTKRVMHNSMVPVLIIKSHIKNFTFNDIVFASAFYGEVNEEFPKLLNVIKDYNATIHLLKVNTPHRFQRTKDSLQLMHEFGTNFELKQYTTNIYNDLSIEDGIVNFSNENSISVLGITTHDLRLLGKFFNSSISSDIARKSSKAILSIHLKDAPKSPIEHFYDPKQISSGGFVSYGYGNMGV